MSALSLPPKPRPTATTTATAVAPVRTRPPARVAPTPPPAPAGPAAPPRRPDLRLVEAPRRSSLAPSGPLQAWRRRLGLLLVVAAVVVLAVQALAQGPAATPEVVPVSTATMVVQPGQTLWDVAGEHAPEGTSPAAYVHELAELNGITNGAVDAWQVLRLPDA